MRIRPKILPLLSILFLFGCQDQDVHTYRIAKEHAEAPSNAAPTGDLAWKIPANWKTLPASGMRLASFAFEGKSGSKADISIVVLPGMAGGDLANVNRWRGQLGLEPLNEASIVAHSQKIKSKAGALLMVDFAGTDPKGEIRGKARMLGAMLSLRDKQWFFKVMGEDPVVTQAKPSFLQFLKSIKPASNS